MVLSTKLFGRHSEPTPEPAPQFHEPIVGEWGISRQDGPIRPLEPPPAPPARELDKAAVMKKFDWTTADFDRAEQKFGLKALSKTPPLGSYFSSPVWSETALDEWAAGKRAEAAELVALVAATLR